MRVAAVLAWLLSTSICAAQDAPATCSTCHPGQTSVFAGSVHHALSCRECHRGEESYAVSPEQAERFAGRTDESGLEFDHGPSFAGRPSRTDVPALCGECHADVERMNPFGLRTDQLAQYKSSRHGKALFTRQDERVAVCTDCHGPPHAVLAAGNTQSRTHPLNVPGTCATCHENPSLMGEYHLPVEILAEYRDSVHGRLLLEQHDTGAPTCATCHGNHSAMPPGFASVGAVCGQCHEHAARNFAASVHADMPEHRGCVSCHGGGEGRHYHLIERITKPAGILIQRYAHLLTTEPEPTPAQISEAINPDPRRIMTRALPICTECHDDPEDDENLPKLFLLLDAIAEAEQDYVKTASRLDRVGQGVLLVENQRFLFEDAKTHLIELSPVQHTLDNELVAEKVAQLGQVCDEVNAQLDELEAGLRLRRGALIPVWIFAAVFSTLLYVKYKRLKKAYVAPPA